MLHGGLPRSVTQALDHTTTQTVGHLLSHTRTQFVSTAKLTACIQGWWLFSDSRSFAIQSRAQWNNWFGLACFELLPGGEQPEAGTSALDTQTVFVVCANPL